MMRWFPLLVVLALGFFAAGAQAAVPIPEGPEEEEAPEFVGAPATQRPVFVPQPPRHPHMAPNERSNLHVDAYQTDSNPLAGPLGRDVETFSTFQAADCASVTFDSRGRIVTICVGLQGPSIGTAGLYLFDAQTLDTLARYDLPPRQPGLAGNPFQDFAGGGYFYLDDKDRAIVPTTTRHIQVIRQTSPEDGFELERDYDVSGTMAGDDKIISALPDWSGRLWYVSTGGVIGTVDPGSGAIRSIATGEKITNSFAVSEDAVYIITDVAMYRFVAGPDGTPQVVWRTPYPNDGVQKPGQSQAGSGTTPSVMTSGPWVAITDNSDPVEIVVLNRDTGAQVCSVPVFNEGQSSTDQSLVTAGRGIVTENNYGYTGPTSTEQGRTTVGGLERVDVNRDGSGCTKRWRSEETAPSVVPKVSLANGLVYTYTKPDGNRADPWYLTTLDFRTGETVYKAKMGTGLGFNNNYAPVTIGPDGTAYVGVLGGLTAMRDATPPPQISQDSRSQPVTLELRLKYDRERRCTKRRRARATVAGPDRELVRKVSFRYRAKRKRDRSAPFRKRFRVGPGRLGRRVRARVRLVDGRRTTLRRAVRPCARATAPGLAG
jgi:hypothetical protein